MKKGNIDGGFMHILLKHYSSKEEINSKEGEVVAIDILNIANVIRNGDPMNEYEITKDDFKDKIGFKQEKNGKMYKVILTKERNGNWFVSMYSNYNQKKEDKN